MSHVWIQTAGGIEIPCPLNGSSGISISTMVDGGRNTLGRFVGSVIGDDKLSVDLEFPALSPQEMKAFLNLFNRSAGGKFVNRFIVFDPRVNDWVTKEMYVGDRSGRPLLLDQATGKPMRWADVKTKLVEV